MRDVGRISRVRAVAAAALLLAACAAPTFDEGPALPDPEQLEITSSQWDAGSFALLDGTTTALRGFLAAPTAPGTHPVALVVHGSHEVCRADRSEFGTWPCPADTEIRNELGLSYLVEALARRGFVAVAPGVNVQYTLGAGEPLPGERIAQILDRTVTALRAGDLGIGTDRVGEQIVGVGHSQGGEALQFIASGQVSGAVRLDGLILLMPSLNTVDALSPVDLPLVVALGTCDGDTGVSGGDYISTALAQPRRNPAALVLLDRASHNATNSVLAPDRFSARGPGCDAPLSADQQRLLLSDCIPLIARALSGRPTSHWTGQIFSADVAAPPGVAVAVVSAGEKPANLQGVSGAGFASLTQCRYGYYTEGGEPGTGPCHRPELIDLVGLPRSVAVAWDNPDATLTVPLSVAADDRVRLRAFADVADERLGDVAIRLRVSIGAWSEEIELQPDPVVRELIPPFRVAHGAILWQTFDFHAKDGGEEVRVEVRAPDAGAFQLVAVSVLA